MPARANWSQVQARHRVTRYDSAHPAPRIRHPRQLPHIPLWARLFADGRVDAALDAAVAAYHRNRPVASLANTHNEERELCR